MPKYKVTATIYMKHNYEVEIEADSEDEAKNKINDGPWDDSIDQSEVVEYEDEVYDWDVTRVEEIQ